MRALTALVVFFCVSTLAGLAFGLSFGALDRLGAAGSLAVGAAAGGWAFLTTERSTEWEKPGPWGWGVIVVFALFSLRSFCWLVYQNGNALSVLSPNNLGDLPLHLTQIHYLANGAPFWPDNPIFAAGKLHYPFGTNLFNSLITLLGMDATRGLVWVGLLGAVLTGLALWHWGGPFGLAAFLFNGGLGGFLVFSRWELLDYQAPLAWKNFPLSMLVTQRGLLYALPCGLLLLSSWRSRFFPSDRQGWRAPKPIELLIYASVPLFHMHTFLFLSFLLGGLFLLSRREIKKEILSLVALALVPASSLVLLVSGTGAAQSAIHLKPGWMYEEGSALWFWLLNFGALPFVVGILAVAIYRQCDRKAAAFVVPAVSLFLICCFVMFAVWEWDNTKLMIWCYLAVVPFIWSNLLAGTSFVLRATTCVLLFFSGAVSLVGGINGRHNGFIIATRSEVDRVFEAVRDLPIQATFAGYPTYNHPLLLVGKKMVAGYTGHLFSHGVDYQPVVTRLNDLMEGRPDWKEAARELGANYLFWGAREQTQYPDSTRPWEQVCLPVAQGDWGVLYSLEARRP